MLYKLIYYFHADVSWLNVFRYITFRTILATLCSLVLLFVFGNWMIQRLRLMQVGQHIREDGPSSHKGKAGTPTMGGCLVLPVVIASTLLWAEISNIYVWLLVFVIFSFGAIGFIDDYLKVARKNSKGLTARSKFGLQVLVGVAVGIILHYTPGFDSRLNVPFLKTITPDLGWGYVLLAAFVIVGASNAVNLTDGLDGLAMGPIVIAFTCYLVFSYLAGHSRIANYLQIPYVSGTGEIAIICGAVLGAGLGFLWYNSYPAELFMGDVGSLPLGAALGAIGVMTKQEIVLIVVGGIFVVEALSVIIQVTYFRATGGKRIFKMAPIHHHFELLGWPESKVTVRFWIIAIILALLSMSTLKLR
ncbi:MAG: phospho-N-acetylmuramoyl-pentapeptide-transferase [Deltaproteobacteria bacterium HGW-Deltaproteobacteria-15]|jgi:phospho-N-acetylmuramoyl-pentapeptide-transferase|nr:MAG: phospho-N-acetylmuramoyl-pentapeptide-transferase [Deltaproteobacteria bacterium HGW-Deltaproteobacteria-15]